MTTTATLAALALLMLAAMPRPSGADCIGSTCVNLNSAIPDYPSDGPTTKPPPTATTATSPTTTTSPPSKTGVASPTAAHAPSNSTSTGKFHASSASGVLTLGEGAFALIIAGTFVGGLALGVLSGCLVARRRSARSVSPA